MQYTPADRAAWRDWLRRHHADKSEAWLVFVKQSTGRANLSYADAVEEALCYGWIDGIKRSIDAEHYTHRFTPRKPNSRWSALNRKRAARLLASGRMAAAGKREVARAKASGTWAAAGQPRARVTMPAELAKRLAKQHKAARFFESLPPSAQRAYMAWVGSAKKAETRERRADEAIGLLASGQRLGMR